MNHKKYWHLSQTHLNLLETCPPLFQKKYIENIEFNLNFSSSRNQEWGKLFHLKMQQYCHGLSFPQIFTHDQQLNESLKALILATENIWESNDIIAKYPEYKINYLYNNFLLTAVYDLVVFYPDKAIIFDWKTYPKPVEKDKLINNWQTKLYLYILAKKFNYKPHQISFNYWFVKLPNKPENLIIKYNKKIHDQTQNELDDLLEKLDLLTNNYLEKKLYFPHHNNCDNCQYHSLFLERSPSETNIPTSLEELG